MRGTEAASLSVLANLWPFGFRGRNWDVDRQFLRWGLGLLASRCSGGHNYARIQAFAGCVPFAAEGGCYSCGSEFTGKACGSGSQAASASCMSPSMRHLVGIAPRACWTTCSRPRSTSSLA